MTVGAIQFDAMFSGADALCVADTSGLTPLSFNPPSSDAIGRFLLSMSDDKSAVDSIRLAMGSIAQNMSSPRDVSKPVVAPVAAGSRPAAIVGKPVVESPDTYCCSTLVVEKPVVEAPIAPIAPVAPTTPTAPVAPVIEPLVAEKPVVEKPVVEAPAAPAASDSRPATIAEVQSTPIAPVATPVVESPVAPVAPGSRPATVATVQVTPASPVATPVVESPVAPAAPATPKAPVAQVVETVVVEKPVVEVPVATDSSPATVAAVPATPTAPVAPDSRPATVATVQVTPASPVATPAVESPAAPVATPVVESPVASAAPDSRPVTVAEVSASPAAPIAKSPVASSPVAPVVEAPVAKSEVAAARPVVAEKRTAAPEEVVVIDLSQESARAASPLREAPFVAAAQQEISASTASARTEAIVEVVSNVAEAIAGQILVTPSLVRGEGQMIVRLKPEVLDGSEIRLSSESGTLAVEVVPSTPNAAKLATEAMPRLETALAEHVSAFRKISVSVRKGKGNEIV